MDNILDAHQHFLKFIVDRVNVGVFILDKNYNIQLWNQFMAAHSGLSSQESIGKNLFELFPSIPQKWFSKKVKSVFLLKSFAFTSWEQRPYIFAFPHNRPITGGVECMRQDCTMMPLKNTDGEVEYVCISIHDVTDVSIYQNMLLEANEKLAAASRIDGLTQLYNRSHWEERLREEVSRCKRYGGTLTLLMFDLDHFKRINDTYGHLGGDEVLKTVSSKLTSLLRVSDIAGRYGGEEFAILLTNTSGGSAENVAERIRATMCAEPVMFQEQSISVSVSLGICELNERIETHERLIELADNALYHSKENGRNQWTNSNILDNE